MTAPEPPVPAPTTKAALIWIGALFVAAVILVAIIVDGSRL